jgi:hypothetical protein
MGMVIDVIGLQQLIRDTQNISEDGKRMTNAVIGSITDEIVLAAKIAAPADLGTIRQNIGKELVSDGIYNVFSNAPESPYQEFGTGSMVNIPAGFEEVAAQFQGGGGGDFAQFILSLVEWIKRKGINPMGNYIISTKTKITKGNKTDIDTQVAYLIARSILKKGLKPQPFLYPAYNDGWEKLQDRMKIAYDAIMNKNV